MVNQFVEERREKVGKLIAMGFSDKQIMKRLDSPERTYYRDKKAIQEHFSRNYQKTAQVEAMRFLRSNDEIRQILWKTLTEAQSVDEKTLVAREIEKASVNRAKFCQNIGILQSTQQPLVTMQNNTFVQQNIDFKQLIQQSAKEYNEVMEKWRLWKQSQQSTN